MTVKADEFPFFEDKVGWMGKRKVLIYRDAKRNLRQDAMAELAIAGSEFIHMTGKAVGHLREHPIFLYSIGWHGVVAGHAINLGLFEMKLMIKVMGRLRCFRVGHEHVAGAGAQEYHKQHEPQPERPS
jgi:hypothetical protein